MKKDQFLKMAFILLLQPILLSLAETDSNSYFGEHSCWTYREDYYEGDFPDYLIRINPVTYTISGDTVINNKSYKKYSDPSIIALRQENKKIFAINASSDSESLLYDFGLELGDSIIYHTTWSEDTTVYVESVDSVLIYNGKKVKRMILTSNEGSVHWLEGIGNMNDLFSNSYPMPRPSCLCGSYYSLNCFVRDGEKLFSVQDDRIDCECDEELPQTYIPMVDETLLWSYCDVWKREIDKYDLYYSQAKFIGDTVINSQNYKKLYTANCSNELRYIASMREEDKKVYAIRKDYGDKEEKLIYDFSLNVGDEFHSPFDEFNTVKVTKIEMIEINGKLRKKYYLGDIWIEGIGTIFNYVCNSLSPRLAYDLGFFLNYQKKNTEIIYHTEEFFFNGDECNPMNIDDLYREENPINYNSINKTLLINEVLLSECSNVFLELIDSNGKVLLRKTIENNLIDLQKYPQGLYFYRISTDAKIIHKGKIVL